MNKAHLNDTNREKFFAGCVFKAGKEIGSYKIYYNKPNEPAFVNRVIELNDKKTAILITSITDHSFSFLHSYFGKVDLITVFFSELIFIPDEIETSPDETDENFLITNQV